MATLRKYKHQLGFEKEEPDLSFTHRYRELLNGKEYLVQLLATENRGSNIVGGKAPDMKP